MGKDFFSRKSKSDFFETPYSMTEQLLENEKFDYDKTVLEPACGNGAITLILNKYFRIGLNYNLKCYDVSDPSHKDFLEEKNKYNYIITNPPFSLWDEFVIKAQTIATEKFAFLGRLEFLTGLKRFNEKLYYDPEYPLTKVYLFVRKVNLSFTKEYPDLRDDDKYPAGMYHYAWFIFENIEKIDKHSEYYDKFCYGNFPIIKMINNNPYILRKNK